MGGDNHLRLLGGGQGGGAVKPRVLQIPLGEIVGLVARLRNGGHLGVTVTPESVAFLGRWAAVGLYTPTGVSVPMGAKAAWEDILKALESREIILRRRTLQVGHLTLRLEEGERWGLLEKAKAAWRHPHFTAPLGATLLRRGSPWGTIIPREGVLLLEPSRGGEYRVPIQVRGLTPLTPERLHIPPEALRDLVGGFRGKVEVRGGLEHGTLYLFAHKPGQEVWVYTAVIDADKEAQK